MSIAVKAAVVRWAFKALASTYRFESEQGTERFGELLASGDAVIFSYWHSRILGCSRYLQLRLLNRGYHLHTMVSRSEDGELITRWIESIGASASRGSSSRGGSAALRSMVRLMNSQPGGAVTTPDGPRGPEREVQAGTILLAQLSGAPILPMSFAADRTWRVRSWDRLIVPKPFSRFHVVIGDPVEVAREIDDEEREALRLRLQGAIREADERAASAAGTEV